jgi:hypothetical protein
MWQIYFSKTPCQCFSEKHTLVEKISRDAKRAAKIRKRLLRDFYIPEHLVVS